MRRLRPRVIALLALVSTLSCESTTELKRNPVPALFELSPEHVFVGSSARTVTLYGEGFVRGSRVKVSALDRPTVFVNDTTLRVTLRETDVATISIFELSVVNGEPGGGTSSPLFLMIGHPRPVVTAVAPTQALVGEIVPTLQVKGRGFTEESQLVIAGVAVASVVSGDTMLTSTETLPLTATSGIKSIVVQNPPPGGASVISGSFQSRNRRPRALSVSADSVLRGIAPAYVIVTGEHLVPGVQAFIGGASRAVTRLSDTQVRVTVSSADVASLGSRSLYLSTPTPGGGASDTLSLRVVVPPPRVLGLNPATATAGAAGFTLQLRGRDFLPDASVEWNGVPRSTTVANDTLLSIALTSADIASEGSRSVQVRIPSRGTSSLLSGFPVLPPAPTLTPGPVVVDLPNRAVVADPVRTALYASVPSTSASYANSVVKLDPLTGAVLDDVFLGSEPDAMAVSDDGSFLYVSLLGAPRVARIDLATFAHSGDLELPAGSLGSVRPEDIVVLPGRPTSVAVSVRNTCCSPRHEGVVLFEGTTMLATRTQGHTGANRITRGPDASFIYGQNNETTEFGFRRIAVHSDGLTEVRVQNLFSGFGSDMQSGGEYAFSNGGQVVSVVDFAVRGNLGVGGPTAVDPARGRVHVLVGGTQIRTFSFTSLAPMGSAAVDGTGLSSLVQWGSDGLALGAGDRIVIVRGTLVGP